MIMNKFQNDTAESFVSYEVALLLKENGFNQHTWFRF